MSSQNTSEARRLDTRAGRFFVERHLTDKDPFPPFGKFAGRPLRSVPIYYLRSIKNYVLVRESYPELVRYIAGRERRGPLKYCKR